MRRIGGALVLAALVWSASPSLLGALADTSVPGAPANVTAVAGTLSAIVQWTPSGSPATSYTVTSNPRGITATVDGSSASATVSGLAFATSYTFTVTGNNASGAGPASTASNAVVPNAPGGPYHPAAARVLANLDLTAGQPQLFNIGEDRVHAPGLSAVVLNVTVTQATTAAGVQVIMRDQAAQTVRVAPGQVESSLVVVQVPQQMNPAFLQVTAGQAHAEVDLVGFFTDARTVRDGSGLLQMIRTATVFDSPAGAGSSTDISVLGQGDVPATGVAAVLVNVTAIGPAGAGSLSLLPQGAVNPGTTTLGFAAGQTTANRAIVPLPADGVISLLDTGAAAEARVDVLGWFSDGSDGDAVGALYTPIPATRVFDSAAQGGPVAAGTSVSIPVWGQGGTPDGASPGPASSALLEVTVSSPAGPGSVAMSGASIVDYAAGQTLTGSAVVQVEFPAGAATLSVLGAATNVAVDLVAFFSGDIIVPGSTKVLTAEQLAGITHIDDGSITFAPGIQISPPVRLSDVINAGASAATPFGLLRRVLSISTAADGSTVLGTRQASLQEALTSFTLEWTSPQSPGTFGMSRGGSTSRLAAPAAAVTGNPLPPPPGTSIDPAWPVFNVTQSPSGALIDLSKLDPQFHSGSEVDVTMLAQARANMVMGLTRSGKFTMHIGFGVGLRGSIEIQLLGQIGIDLKGLLQHFFPAGPPIFIAIAIVIFEFQFGAEPSLELQLSLAAGVVVHLGLDRYLEVSGGYDGSNFFLDQPTIKNYLAPAQEFNWRPSLQAQAEFDLHTNPEMNIYGGAGKIIADVYPFARVTVDPLAPHWWDFQLGFCFRFHFGLNLIFLTRDEAFLPVCAVLVDVPAPGRLLAITITPSAATVPRSGTQHFHADVPLSPNGVIWSLEQPGGGTLSNATQFDVDYTAPAIVGTYQLRAEAVDDPTSAQDVDITVKAVAPSPPLNVTAALSGTGSVTVTWNPPADDGGAPVIGYQVSASNGGGTVSTDATTTTAVFVNLAPGTYTFTVTSENKALLTSAPSAPSNPVTVLPAGPMSVVPPTIPFGNVTLGQSSAPQTVVVTADGVPLVVSSVTLAGANPGEFTIQSDACSGQTVQPGNTCSFTVVYTPTQQISVAATVLITDSDATSPQTVTLSGSSPVQAQSGLFAVGDVEMVDSQVGYVVDAGTFNRANVMKTTDGGKTWVRLPTPANVVIDANDINFQFLDADHGFVFACLPSSSGACITALLISTSDGGQTWHQLSNVPDHLGVKSMSFTDSMHGWITGGLAGPTPPPDYFGASALTGIYATADGGVTWTKETLPDPILATPDCIPLSFNTGVHFVDPLHGWLAGTSTCNSTIAPHGVIAQGSLVWTTSDGGATWVVHQLPSEVISLENRELDALSASQMRTVAVLQDTPVERHIYLVSTEDGGASFSFSLAPQVVGPADLVFTDPTHGILVGVDGSVWRTADEGASWTQAGTLPKFLSSAGPVKTYTYTRMGAPDPNDIWVVGSIQFGISNFSLQTAGFIESSSDGGATWTVQLLGNGT